MDPALETVYRLLSDPKKILEFENHLKIIGYKIKGGLDKIPFHSGLNPIINVYYDLFVNKVNNIELSNKDRIIIKKAFLDGLWLTCSKLTSRVLASEYQFLIREGLLDGLDSKLDFFCESILLQPEGLSELLNSFPYLWGRVSKGCACWVENFAQFTDRLIEDHHEIVRHFGENFKLSQLTEVKSHLSDPHRGGKTVFELSFGPGDSIFYKPRPLAIEFAFSKMTDFVFSRLHGLNYDNLKMIERSGYGWVLGEKHFACSTTQDLQFFYQRMGVILVIMYACNGTDFHCENVIASGATPKIIDLETLFHPIGLNRTNRLQNIKFFESVLKSSILPYSEDIDAGARTVDESALTNAFLQEYSIPQWLGLEDGNLRIGEKKETVMNVQHAPLFDGQNIRSIDHLDDLMHGFEIGYLALMSSKLEFLELINSFAGLTCRFIAERTRYYAAFLVEAGHPRNLINAETWQRFLAKTEVHRPGWFSRIIESEKNDIDNGDIPYFHHCLGDPRILDSKNEHVLTCDILDPLAHCKSIISNLSYEDLEFQQWLIKGSFLNYKNVITKHVVESIHSSEAVLDGESIIRREAGNLVDTIQRYRISTNGSHSWVGLSIDGGYWQPSSLGQDLYNGLSGVFSFLMEYALMFREPKLMDLVLDESLVQFDLPAKPDLGAFTGSAGAIYFLNRLYIHTGERKLLEIAKKQMMLIKHNGGVGGRWDYLCGNAGIALALLRCWEMSKDEDCLDLAYSMALSVAGVASASVDGAHWPFPIETQAPLLGLSHGNAGIAYSLAAVSQVTHDCSLYELASQALLYEHRRFDPNLGNWPDHRYYRDGSNNRVGGPQSMHSWCHGAPGIGMARVKTYNLLPTEHEAILIDIDQAMSSTSTSGFATTDSLCHGDFGNLELFLLHGTTMHVPESITFAHTAAFRAIKQKQASGRWHYALPDTTETIGFMLGASGIGYQLLRLLSPEKVPSILLLE